MTTYSSDRMIPQTIQVLIVDDHPLFRSGLQKAIELEDDLTVIGHCESGEQALIDIRHHQPDVILLDINLPGMNGLQVARHIKSEPNSPAIIILTAYHDDEQVILTMRTGASAYCGKDVDPDDLVNIIRDVNRGYYVIGDQRMTLDELEDWLQSRVERLAGPYSTEIDGQLVPLSPREMEILELVTQGMINKHIAHKLGISQQTVKNHMTSILRKLNVGDRTQAAIIALRRGWVRIEDNNQASDK